MRALLILCAAVLWGFLAQTSDAVLGGVLQFNSGGSVVQAPIYQVALGSGGSILWATAPLGVIYQINATTMALISNTTLASPSCTAGTTVILQPTGLFVDDAHSRVYVSYAPAPGTAPCMSVFILNESTRATISSAGYVPASTDGTMYDMALSLHYYDPSSRAFLSVSWLENWGEFGVQLYNVTSDTVSSGGVSISYEQETAISGIHTILYVATTDTFYALVELYAASRYLNFVGIGPCLVQCGSPGSFENQFYIQPFGYNTPIVNSGLFVGMPSTFTSNYIYDVYVSTSDPSQGSYLMQFNNPLTGNNIYGSEIGGNIVAKSAIQFTNQSPLFAVALDETAINGTEGVLFVATSNGQVLKYRYTDPGGTSASLVLVGPNYNVDTWIASPPPLITSQAYSKTTQALYYASSAPAGGIWRVPFYSCGVAASCAACAALDDPYCGWCPLSGTCTTNASCSTGKIFTYTNRAPSPFHPLTNTGRIF
jgi:hypothetical protein